MTKKHLLKRIFLILFLINPLFLFGNEFVDSFMGESFFSADFIQSTEKDEDKRVATGSIQASRDGFFKLTYFEPFKETIASDGVDLYRHDPDLEQLEIHPTDNLFNNSPVSLFFRSKEELNNLVVFESCYQENNKVICPISFLNEDFSISEMKIVFIDNLLSEITYRDSFLQTINISFSNQSSLYIDKKDFEFEVSEETDVISYKIN
tara:strand:- start:1289 stop:1909 length:621 start_codon:yes stop_codon:yes gene_type:complete